MSVASQEYGARPDLSRDAAQRAGLPLLVFAGLGALLALQSLFSAWLSLRVTVDPVAEYEARHGIGHFGAASAGFGVGLVVLAVLVGVALWGRWRTGPATAVLALALLLVADAWVVFARLARVRHETAAEVVRLRDSAEGMPTEVLFRVDSPGLYEGLAATFLFALVAVLLRWPGQGPQVQAVGGTAVAVVAAALPWTRLWIIDDTRPGVPFEVRTSWIASGGLEGYALVVELLVLLGLVGRCFRAPGYARASWAWSAAALGGLLVLSVQLREINSHEEAFALGDQVSEVIETWSTGAGPLLAVGASLLAVAAVRAWWHGREEIPPAVDDDGWLPRTLRARR